MASRLTSRLSIKFVSHVADTVEQVQATNNAPIQMNVIQNNFVNRNCLRGRDYDLQVDEKSYRQDEELTTAKINEITVRYSENDLREATDSIVGKVERIPLMVDNIDLEEIFIDYCDRCETSLSMPKSESLKKVGCLSSLLICPSMTKKQKDSLQDWKDAWHDKKEIDEDLLDVVHNILGLYIEAFEAPYNVLKSRDLEEKQFSAQFISPILKKYTQVLTSKRADGLAHL
ncbi:hypothetical protein GLOIN_2v1763995 [Rhizophagus irregularis DAOM 181602=DAOM 197198]|uniref:Uncharacterized protein n=1 Tax=Rhizophagus irregularis (strain DAOM 181602 / DAOM 197198 / MUCL 43194) TaxID=747089 RepID=A0A2P4QSZ2_RHIID|nr:hypothetical protein GLOIN_2v1763995 [Rhizophagus irregularis DAOM 181602=DAOM 197198]POG80750.1 hypothetical protein GLOIN_2v1763995 [Rhizophagus irregularis DAOM 181602=DAOM 197198]|eukprot:XP_025187616.1 hypothetical protein GLOIN_2v1763995 [Rhizophagus irregularis DAOM 181602=DAOM 197198]